MFALLTSAVSLATSPAAPGAGAPVRLALVVSSNHGLAGEEPLLYADADARRVADLLEDLGGYRPGDVWTVSNAHVDSVFSTLARVTVRAQEVANAGGTTSLLVFYAGHAGPDGLHANGQVLALADLKSAIRVVPAGDRIVVLDACNAGSIARSRGASLVDVSDQPTGFAPPSDEAWLVSSGPEERSFEVEDRRGALFTHFFLSGARGAADADGDTRVTLGELYGFVQTHTAEAAAGFGALQQPRWAGALAGFTLTNIGASPSGVRVVGPVLDPLLVIDERLDEVVAEVPRGAGANLALDGGSYQVVAVRDDGLSLGRLQISPEGWTLWSPAEHLQRVAAVRSRGGFYDTTPWALRAGTTLGVGTLAGQVGAPALLLGVERALGRGHVVQVDLTGSVLPFTTSAWSGARTAWGGRVAWTREVLGRGLTLAPGLALSGGVASENVQRAPDPIWGAWYGSGVDAQRASTPYAGLEVGAELSLPLGDLTLSTWAAGGLSANGSPAGGTSPSSIVVVTPSARLLAAIEVPFR
jgi:Caspase domain